MRAALKRHWPEYLSEAVGLGLFMVLICLVVALLEHPLSPIQQKIALPQLRRWLIGLAIGLSVTGLIYSPWGKRSGAHLNPSVTLAFWRLGKVAPWDAVFYIVAQFAGGLAGVLLCASVMREYIAAPPIRYVATVPGAPGVWLAFAAELAMSFVLMWVILTFSNSPRLARFTGCCVGVLVALYIGVEAPLSGMSLNPARTLSSAIPANLWTALWVYFTAPPLGMLLAAHLYQQHAQEIGGFCAKLHHQDTKRCIFCEYHQHEIAT